MAAAATGMDEPFIMPIGMGLNFLSSQYSDRLLLSTADQCVNTARRHFDARGQSCRVDWVGGLVDP